jgi:Mg2+ and Co2+ transporter CorA
MKEKTPPGPPRDSVYNDLIYWAQRPEAFKKAHADNSASNVHVPIQALLHIICAEWLTIADYIKTRLGQIEWEISFPEHFLDKRSDIDVALKKLHVWRRLVPLYREMLTETLQRAFHFPCHTTNMVSIEGGLVNTTTNGINDNTNQQKQCQCPLHSAPVKQSGPISAFSDDFTRALSYMEEYQQRIDRLTSVVTAIISIADSRRGQDDNRNVARLTWLATFFIPLSFMSGLFSMQADLSQLKDSYKLYFEIAVPLALASLGLAAIVGLPGVRRFGHRMRNKLRTSTNKKNK